MDAITANNYAFDESWASEVIFAESLAAPELYANNALLVYCMANCHCAARQRKRPDIPGRDSDGENDDEDEWDDGDEDLPRRKWLSDGLRPGITIDSTGGGLIVRNSNVGVEKVLVEPLSRLNAGLGLGLGLSMSAMTGLRRGGGRCGGGGGGGGGTCLPPAVCSNSMCTTPTHCGPDGGSLSGCACRASLRVDGQRGKATAWCGAIPLFLPDSLLGKRGDILESCACNASYVSHGCCGSLDGIVWEGAEAWLGGLL
jgi:hypothetical protein